MRLRPATRSTSFRSNAVTEMGLLVGSVRACLLQRAGASWRSSERAGSHRSPFPQARSRRRICGRLRQISSLNGSRNGNRTGPSFWDRISITGFTSPFQVSPHFSMSRKSSLVLSSRSSLFCFTSTFNLITGSVLEGLRLNLQVSNSMLRPSRWSIRGFLYR